MKTAKQEFGKSDQPLLYYEIHDEMDKKSTNLKIVFLLLVSIAFGMGLIYVLKDNMKGSNDVLTTAIREIEVGGIPSNRPYSDEVMSEKKEVARGSLSNTGQRIQAFSQDLKFVDEMETEWEELDLVFKDPTSDVALPLEHDVFHRLDLDGDGKLSKEELSRFFTSVVMKNLGSLTRENMRELKNYIQYPIFKITDDMTDAEIQKICDQVAFLKNTDFEEAFEMEFGNDPLVLINKSLEMVDLDHLDFEQMNFEEFHAFLDESEHIDDEDRTSAELQIPDQCRDRLNGRTRRGLLKLFVCLGEGAGAAAEHDAKCRQKNGTPIPSEKCKDRYGNFCPLCCGGKRRERRELGYVRRNLLTCTKKANRKIFKKYFNKCIKR